MYQQCIVMICDYAYVCLLLSLATVLVAQHLQEWPLVVSVIPEVVWQL